MRVVVWAIAMGAGIFLTPALGQDDKAPFGFSWGPMEKFPRPSLATKEGNVTLLIYHRDRLFSPDELRDTEEVVLEVCQKEGLQQVIWVSRLLSDGQTSAKTKAILEEGARRYGTADMSQQDVISWNAGRTKMTIISDKGLSRVLMKSIGPAFENCAMEHDAMTGPPMNDHWNRHFLDISSQ